MSSSVGLGISLSSTAAFIICPDWQYPHCGTSISSQARCRGWLRSGERPSIVVTSFPAARVTGATHERTAWPSIWTVHAPHGAIPQPYLVPVNSRFSRRTQSRGVEGSTSTFTRRLFTLNEITWENLLWQKPFVVEELVVECYRAGASAEI